MTQLIKFADNKTKIGEISEKYGDKVVCELDKKLASLKLHRPMLKKPDLD